MGVMGKTAEKLELLLWSRVADKHVHPFIESDTDRYEKIGDCQHHFSMIKKICK